MLYTAKNKNLQCCPIYREEHLLHSASFAGKGKSTCIEDHPCSPWGMHQSSAKAPWWAEWEFKVCRIGWKAPDRWSSTRARVISTLLGEDPTHRCRAGAIDNARSIANHHPSCYNYLFVAWFSLGVIEYSLDSVKFKSLPTQTTLWF